MEKKTIVCISCYLKGYEFMDEMYRLGNDIILITSDKLKDKKWPWHAIKDTFYMSEIEPSIWNLEHLIEGFSYLTQHTKVDAVIALDDYDVEKAALIRETFRIPGMGQTTQRYFRDKLAMRQRALDSHIAVPEFTNIFNNKEIIEYCDKVPSPWVLKPRSEASATGIKKITSTTQLWEELDNIGAKRYHYLLESFKPGDVYHVDSLVYQNEVIFTSASQYLAPPMEVSHDGGVFRTKTLCTTSAEYQELKDLNEKILKSFGLSSGATHTEFIKGKTDGKWYFLETSARVGGAHIAEMVEAATHINLWREWARLENARLKRQHYSLPQAKNEYAGLIIALAKDKYPNTINLQHKDVLKFLEIDHHIGVLYHSRDPKNIDERLQQAAEHIYEHILNIIPPRNKPMA